MRRQIEKLISCCYQWATSEGSIACHCDGTYRRTIVYSERTNGKTEMGEGVMVYCLDDEPLTNETGEVP